MKLKKYIIIIIVVSLLSMDILNLFTGIVTAVVEENVPSVLKGKTVAIKQYESVEDLKTALTKNSAVGADITETVLSEVNSFLASFGVDSEDVKVTLNGVNNIVTIENEGTESVEIQGLK